MPEILHMLLIHCWLSTHWGRGYLSELVAIKIFANIYDLFMQLRFTLLRIIQHLSQNLFRVTINNSSADISYCQKRRVFDYRFPAGLPYILIPISWWLLHAFWQPLLCSCLQCHLLSWKDLLFHTLHPLYLFFIWNAVQRSTGIEFLKCRYNVHNEMWTSL